MRKLNRVIQKLDSRPVGLIIGILFPLITITLLWQWKYSESSLGEMLHFVRQSSTNKNNFIIFPILPNLVLFYFSNFRLKMNRFTEGMVFITVVYTVVIALLILL